ncbi:PREDICTED: 1-acyl-sn-glycerol-3-phosphate acyltransferase gamma-like [Priapulus caudatus]|uniref:1-acyl-sn-glycerol-3-phosphate acyltransferase gamma-like n=1 Tax=Priapulus caudatus TaxID=37621 RepID=A0ABM1EUY5_PRICU|nr:PREDICTED: 1-acyl-sn-glycerol-3-phosphate acyltransferase gamma-like [Priapulus caudatus]
MGFIAQFKTWFLPQLFLGYVFIISGLIVNLLQLCCCCLVWPFSKKWYRIINSKLCYSHWIQLVFLAEWWADADITLVVDNEADAKYYGTEHGIVILNHSYEIDWLMGWMLCGRCNTLGSSKIYGKKILKYFPIIGWAWAFSEVIFLERNWEKDKSAIMKAMDNLADFPLPVWLLLFCEGTRFTEAKHKASLEFARSRGLPELKYHLLPRTKGFVLSVQGFKGKFPAIYDAVVGFPRDAPAPNMVNILNGRGMKAEMYCRRIPIESVPSETEEECVQWLYELYQNKDKVTEYFKEHDHFEGHRIKLPKKYSTLIVELVWCLLLSVPLFMYLRRVVTSDSSLPALAVITFLMLASYGMRKMIGLTQIEHSSSYGKTTTATEKGDTKKEQ